MGLALRAARVAGAAGDVPIGAALVAGDGAVLAVVGNEREQHHDPTAHAEVLALRRGAELRAAAGAGDGWRLTDCTLVVTLEPCPMCAAAIAAARIAVLYYGAADPRMGGVAHGARVFDHPQCHHRPEVYEGIAAEAAQSLLRGFFAARR